MTGSFTGWPEQAFDVLLQLEGDPSAEVRKRCRRDRERLVRQPMIALLHDAAAADEAFEDFSVWGYGITPWWWQHQHGVVRMAGRFEIGLRFDLDGLWVQGGWGHRHLDRFRAAVADKTSGAELVRILDLLRRRGFEISGDVMKRGPRGYPPAHQRQELLRHRTLGAGRPLEPDDWLHTPEAVGWVLETFAELRPLMSWLDANVADDCRDCFRSE